MFELLLTLWLVSEPTPLFLTHPKNPFPTLEACRAELRASEARTLAKAKAAGLTREVDFDFQMKCVPLAGDGV